MDVALLIGRVLFGLLFLLSAAGHLAKTNDLAGYAAARGVPLLSRPPNSRGSRSCSAGSR